MVTTAELNRRGLPYAVVVDGAATPASLADLDDKGLPYLVEVADGATMASRRALEARGLRYLVPVLVDATAASKASLAAQGLRYAVQVDADILPADKATLHRQGLTYYVEVDSSGNSVAVVAAGGAALLTGEANGFATDFLWPVDAERVAVKTSGASVASTVDAFYANAGTSPKMVYDAAGVLGWSPHNMCLQSQTFDNVFWAKQSGTVTANAVAAPDGTTTADAYIPGSGSVDSHLSLVTTALGLVVGQTYALSFYIKNGTLGNNWLQLLINQTSTINTYFNLSAGTIGTVSGSPISRTITDTGSGWYRVVVSFTASDTSFGIYFAPRGSDGGGTVAGNGTSPAYYAWGAQINRGIVATAYLPTTTAARFGLALDYDPVTHAAKGLLCEPAGTNLITRSNDLSFLTAEQGTTTVDNQTGPDGLLTADTFTENTSAGTHNCYGTVGVTANTDYTISRFLKMGTRRYATIGWSDGTNGAYAVYDLQTGVVGSSAAFGTGTLNSAGTGIQALPNGWYRCILSAKIGVTVGYQATGTANAATITPDGFGRQSFLGTGATLFMGHLQVEAGTVATSPIPTLAASVTRAADQVTVTPASINYSATAGSWWAEVYLTGLPPVGNYGRIIGSSSTAAFPLGYNPTAQVAFYDADVSLLETTGVSNLTNNIHKIASAFQSGSQAMTADGLAVLTGTGASANLLNLGVAVYIGYGTNVPMNGYFRKLRYLPRRPTNAELVTMTT